ncbi:MAG: 1-acyl-sn-glycerol-3-phosphate acyltransferase [Myxococcales bacterium]|nr:1-acyl-sn-glycerol-3-phosphate acyltransferase [Myxococcales bacterium]
MLRALKRCYRATAATVFLVGFFLGGPVIALIALPFVFAAPQYARSLRARRVLAAGYRFFLGWMRRASVIVTHVQGAESRPEGPAVYVANHPSILDIVPMCAYVAPFCIVVRLTPIRRACFAAVTSICDYVVVRDGSLQETEQLMEACVARLAKGESVFIFPEGTRSPRGGLHAFSTAAFEIAERAGVPVVPVHIRVSAPVFAKDSSMLDWPEELVSYALEVLPSFSVEPGRPGVRAARDRARVLLAEGVGLMQSPDPRETGSLGAVHGA